MLKKNLIALFLASFSLRLSLAVCVFFIPIHLGINGVSKEGQSLGVFAKRAGTNWEKMRSFFEKVAALFSETWHVPIKNMACFEQEHGMFLTRTWHVSNQNMPCFGEKRPIVSEKETGRLEKRDRTFGEMMLIVWEKRERWVTQRVGGDVASGVVFLRKE